MTSEIDREFELSKSWLAASNSSLRNQLYDRKNYLTTELGRLSTDVNYLESTLSNFEPSILIKGQVSSKIIGIKPRTAYSLIFVLAIFLALVIVVGSAFVSKVQDRLAGRG